ncbi:MAG: hypothetical protein EBZ77_11685, partial [Chitinophagia bacterium]|nr:hypothetical protein [Chitinophagia bacterium]
MTLVLLINSTPVQNYLAHHTAIWLSKRIHSKVDVKYVRVDLLNHLDIGGLYIEDQQKDTLLYAGEATVNITDWFIFKDLPVLHELSLKDAFVHAQRRKDTRSWNYDFIADAFTTGNNKNNDTSQIIFNLEKARLENVRLYLDDAWTGEDIDLDIGKITLDARKLDFKTRTLTVDRFLIAGSSVRVNEYKGSKPDDTTTQVPDSVDAPFNPDHWQISFNEIGLRNCRFSFTSDTNKPLPNLFDYQHIDIHNIDLTAKDTRVIDDTIHGKLTLLHAQERCGFKVVDMRADVTVSPIASICNNLYLETNRSKLGNYYAMHYRRFPNFLEYIDSVQMVAHVRQSSVDTRDIAYFAPEMKYLPGIMRISGD